MGVDRAVYKARIGGFSSRKDKKNVETKKLNLNCKSTPVVLWLSYSPLDPRFAAMEYFRA